MPWKETKRVGAEKVLSVVFESNMKQNCCDNVIDVVSNSIGILCHELSNYELEGADYILKIKVKNDISLLDTSKIDYLYKLGYETAKENIKKIKEAIFKNK